MRKVSGLRLSKPKQFYAMFGSIVGETKTDDEDRGQGEECVGI